MTTLKVFGVISIVLGGLAVLAWAADPTVQDAGYTLVGGVYLLAHGIISVRAANTDKPVV
jgi:uncharacterized membrane protein HdeD (DUF308 family)